MSIWRYASVYKTTFTRYTILVRWSRCFSQLWLYARWFQMWKKSNTVNGPSNVMNIVVCARIRRAICNLHTHTLSSNVLWFRWPNGFSNISTRHFYHGTAHTFHVTGISLNLAAWINFVLMTSSLLFFFGDFESFCWLRDLSCLLQGFFCLFPVLSWWFRDFFLMILSILSTVWPIWISFCFRKWSMINFARRRQIILLPEKSLPIEFFSIISLE